MEGGTTEGGEEGCVGLTWRGQCVRSHSGNTSEHAESGERAGDYRKAREEAQREEQAAEVLVLRTETSKRRYAHRATSLGIPVLTVTTFRPNLSHGTAGQVTVDQGYEGRKEQEQEQSCREKHHGVSSVSILSEIATWLMPVVRKRASPVLSRHTSRLEAFLCL